MANKQDRTYIRHATDIPLEVEPYSSSHPYNLQLTNVSVGGLAFDSPVEFDRGDLVKIRINITQPPFNVDGVVQWCRVHNDHFMLGVEFLGDEDAFRVRMMEQVCYIEQYHQLQLRKGRQISKDEASREWIERSAAKFPN